MAIAALTVDDLTEQSLSDHVHDAHLDLAVAAILQQHEGSFGSLVGADQVPAVLDGVGAAYFHAHGDAPLHGVDGDGEVGLPGAHDEDGVHVVTIQHLSVIRGGKGAVALAVYPLGLLGGAGDALLQQVADGGDPHVVHMQKQGFQHVLAAGTQADGGDSDLIHDVVRPFGLIGLLYYK